MKTCKKSSQQKCIILPTKVQDRKTNTVIFSIWDERSFLIVELFCNMWNNLCYLKTYICVYILFIKYFKGSTHI